MKFFSTAACAFAVIGFLCAAGDTARAADFPTKLYLSQDGVALSSFPRRQVVKRTIIVTRTQGDKKAGWTAASDQLWLSVSPKGKTGGKLTVTANIDGLAPDQFYSANVTVSTSKADFNDTETLRVGLWIGSSNPGDKIFLTGASGVYIATNPVRPIAYDVAQNGKSVRAFNVYTGALLATFADLGKSLSDLEVSSDGATLFVADMKSLNILALDAGSGAILGTYPMGYPQNTSRDFNFAYARPYGQPALYIPGSPDGTGTYFGQIMAYPSGEQLAYGFKTNIIAPTPDGRTVVTMEAHTDPGTFHSYSVDLAQPKLTLTEMLWHWTSSVNCSSIDISTDAKHVYMACGLPYEVDAFDPKTGDQVQTFPLGPYPESITIDPFGNAVIGLSLQSPGKNTVFVYGQEGFPKGKLKAPGTQFTAIRVSGDGTRLVTTVGPNTLLRNMP